MISEERESCELINIEATSDVKWTMTTYYETNESGDDRQQSFLSSPEAYLMVGISPRPELTDVLVSFCQLHAIPRWRFGRFSHCSGEGDQNSRLYHPLVFH